MRDGSRLRTSRDAAAADVLGMREDRDVAPAVVMQAEERALAVVLAWVEARLEIRRYADLRPVAVSVLVVSLLAGWGYGMAVLAGYLVWFLVTVPPALKLVRDVVTVIEPAALQVPEGLADIAVMAAMLDQLEEVRGKNRGSRLRVLAADNFTADGRARRINCFDGHTALCEHRASPEAARLWGEVGAQR